MNAWSGWSRWSAFPDPEEGGYLCAPFGPGVYELRNRETGQLVLFGRGKNLAYRMSSLLPAPWGAGNRNNVDKKKHVREHLTRIEYRTKACTSDKQSRDEERVLRTRNSYIFPT